MSHWTECESVSSRLSAYCKAAFLAALLIMVGPAAYATAEAGESESRSMAATGIWAPLAERLVDDGIDHAYVVSLFSRSGLEFDPDHMAHKMRSLLSIKQAARGAAPAREPEVMDRYLNPILIAGAYAYLRENREALDSARQRYGVEGDYLVALLLVETRLGTNTGKHKAMPVLASMALAGDFSLISDKVDTAGLDEEMKQWLVARTKTKGDWAYQELVALIEYARGARQDPLTVPGSIYGAIGICQFMPSTARHYGVDGDGDGRVNLFERADALHSMANFLKEHGWKKDMDTERRLKVLYRYNHSESYALTVDAVAQKLRGARELFGG